MTDPAKAEVLRAHGHLLDALRARLPTHRVHSVGAGASEAEVSHTFQIDGVDRRIRWKPSAAEELRSNHGLDMAAEAVEIIAREIEALGQG